MCRLLSQSQFTICKMQASVLQISRKYAHIPPKIVQPKKIEDVRFVVAVASGKGGVGKSTTAINIAAALKKLGWRIGLLDADVYGPSIPILSGLRGRMAQADANTKKLLPLSNHGIDFMSMGFLSPDEDAPTIWRGPMVMSALNQLLYHTKWPKLDVLLVDMPPGTGDAALTLSQNCPLSGAVIVSTPQDIALIDARKGGKMFEKVRVPILGMIQNMAYHICGNCGNTSHIFGKGGVEKTAKDFDWDVLGSIPLHGSIRETSDEGCPVVIAIPDSPQSLAYLDAAKLIKQKLESAESANVNIDLKVE